MIDYSNFENKGGIYCIECIINGKQYIGQSKNVLARMRGHRSALRNNMHNSTYMQDDWNKYGEENFKAYVLEYIENDKERDLAEIKYIDMYNTTNRRLGYNIESGGLVRSEMSKETKKLVSLHHADVSGRNNPFYGKHHPQEIMDKILNNPNYINRKHRGEDNHNCSISEHDVREIKIFFKDLNNNKRGIIQQLADKYHVSKMVISHIKNGHSWKWLEV